MQLRLLAHRAPMFKLVWLLLIDRAIEVMNSKSELGLDEDDRLLVEQMRSPSSKQSWS